MSNVKVAGVLTGSSNSLTVINLPASTVVWVQVIEFNQTGGGDQSYKMDGFNTSGNVFTNPAQPLYLGFGTIGNQTHNLPFMLQVNAMNRAGGAMNITTSAIVTANQSAYFC